MRARTLLIAAVPALAACAGTAASNVAPTRATPSDAGLMPAISNPPAVSDPRPTPPTPPVPVEAGPTHAGTVGTGSVGTGSGPSSDVPDGSATRTNTSLATNATTPTTLVGQGVSGNRLLGLGDSIMASVSHRYTDDLCKALVPLGWDVEVEAESGRFVTFGADVIKKLTRPPSRGPWDVVVIGFGSNYRGDPLEYRTQLESLIDSVAPAHVVLVTVTPFETNRADVNEIITAIAKARPATVSVADWGTVSTVNADELLGGDQLHLSDKGRIAYASQVADLLGVAPSPSIGAPATVEGSGPSAEVPTRITMSTTRGTYDSVPVTYGACRTSTYTDDSAGPVQGTGTRPRPPVSSTRSVVQTTQPRVVVQTTKRRRSSTTRPRKTTTTAAPSTTEPTPRS